MSSITRKARRASRAFQESPMGRRRMHGQDNRTSGIALAVPSELIAAIADRVADVLEQRGLTTNPAPSPWMGVENAAHYIEASGKQRVYDLVHEGALRPARDGRRLLFHREELDRYLRGEA